MTNSNQEDARKLRQILIDMAAAGQGESGDPTSFLKRFLPLKSHARILESDCHLIIGHRGAGKTELFRALKIPGGAEAIASVSTRIQREDIERIQWTVGYTTEGTDYPPEILLRNFAKDKEDQDIQMLWLAYLAKALHRTEPAAFSNLPDTLFEASKLETIFETATEHLTELFAAFDALDQRLAQEDRKIFVTYDELDRVSASDWEALSKIIRGLVQLWSSYTRRWRCIRPKIFLRKDLYTNAAIAGPDISKISATRLELSWSVRDLYTLFFKRFVNWDPEMVKGYFGRNLPQGSEQGAMGWLPDAKTEDDFKLAIHLLCGEFMGASATKGRTFTWIPTHLQDSHGEVLPRSFIRIFEKAAEIENRSNRAKWPQILYHSSLKGALDEVSLARMEELKEEFRWIETLRKHLLEMNLKVPMERKELQDALQIDWSTLNEEDRPPFKNTYDLVQFLGELGIFFSRQDKRIDVRDIYLRGLGFKRKGGVQRPF